MTKILLRLAHCGEGDYSRPEVRTRCGVLCGIVGICCNVLLCCGKLIAGQLSGSISILSDALNNLSDAGSAVVTLVGFHMSSKPPDEEHPFGHSRIEYIIGIIVALIILMMGFELGKTSVEKIISPEPVELSILSLIILCVSVCVKFWMFLFNRKVGRLIGSEAMQATARDSLSDMAATTAVIVGVLIGHFAHLAVDGYLGLLVAGFICYSGFTALRDTVGPLIGELPSHDLVEGVTHTVLSYPQIRGIHDMIVHNYGPGRTMLSLHAEVPADMDLLEAHDIIDMAEREISTRFSCDAVIHMDPVVLDDEVSNGLQARMRQILTAIDPTLTLHDFRMTSGPYHTNLIFDVVVPPGCKLPVEKLPGRIQQAVDEDAELKKTGKSYYVVIHIDRGYVS